MEFKTGDKVIVLEYIISIGGKLIKGEIYTVEYIDPAGRVKVEGYPSALPPKYFRKVERSDMLDSIKHAMDTLTDAAILEKLKPTVVRPESDLYLCNEGTTGTLISSKRPESDHYHTGSIDVWKFADENFSVEEVTGFHRIDAIKYLARYGKKKGYNRADLEKARVEIDKLLELHDKHRMG